jgi:hypothetical protein
MSVTRPQKKKQAHVQFAATNEAVEDDAWQCLADAAIADE